jgi:phage tail tape-measure protein
LDHFVGPEGGAEGGPLVGPEVGPEMGPLVGSEVGPDVGPLVGPEVGSLSESTEGTPESSSDTKTFDPFKETLCSRET